MITLWIGLASAGVPTVADAVALHLGFDGREVDQATVGAAYDAACEAGSELACKWRSWDDFGQPRHADLARLARTPCDQDDAEACLLVAMATGSGPDGGWDPDRAVDPTRSAVLVQRACDAGIVRGCVELGTLFLQGFALPVEPDTAAGLFEAACGDGVGVGCLRRANQSDPPDAAWLAKARAAGEPGALEDLGDRCTAGVVAACEAHLEAVDGPQRVVVLESLCRMDERHCDALAVARATHDAGPLDDLPERSPDRATTRDGGVLVGWRGATWSPHVWFAADRVSSVRVRVSGPRREAVEVDLTPGQAGGEPTTLVLPGQSCDTLVPQIRGLSPTHLARVVDDAGLPMASTCLDALPYDERPDHITGMLVVEAENPDFVREVAALREGASKLSEALFACGDAVDREAVLDPLQLAVVVKRGGVVQKVKRTSTSGDEGFDTCVIEWLRGVDAGDAITLTTKLTLTTRLLW